MIPLLPRWNLMPNRASFYDTDSATLLELASTLHATMNNLITDYNQFVEGVNTTIAEFTKQSADNQENFEVGMRQEFQDFINIIDLKVNSMENAINTMIENQASITENLINTAIKTGQIMVTERYNEETESLEMIITGGV